MICRWAGGPSSKHLSVSTHLRLLFVPNLCPSKLTDFQIKFPFSEIFWVSTSPSGDTTAHQKQPSPLSHTESIHTKLTAHNRGRRVCNDKKEQAARQMGLFHTLLNHCNENGTHPQLISWSMLLTTQTDRTDKGCKWNQILTIKPND